MANWDKWDTPSDKDEPGHSPSPNRFMGMVLAILGFVGVLCIIFIKLVMVIIAFIIAFIAALAWRR